ncbi:hypothetical protein [Lapidilactobacillus bayanensis]|uniref:hypothetical protein n=1 Tax=Lapidilactobacillus bayanensis TaxID=2485998 RepID=UPI000F7706CA|nr:hypothetical protein [Lapidilactobacillus bayanensis]
MHKELVLTWAQTLKEHQLRRHHSVFDGGILCPACLRMHGRSMDAMLPLLYAGVQLNDPSYLESAEALFWWSQRNVAAHDGSFVNDPGHPWKGTTIFTITNYIDCLTYFGNVLSAKTKQAILAQINTSLPFIENFMSTVETNINYWCAGTFALALAGKFLQRPELIKQAQQAMSKIKPFIQADGLLVGEGRAHDLHLSDQSAKGALAFDVGYNVEESLPSLVHYALLMNDPELLETLKKVLKTHLNFFLADGGWNNSFGNRNAKWSYWGSRTSDGCQGAYAYFPEPEFQAVAARNLQLLQSCTHDGLLTGGPMFTAAGQPTCIHHTFSHAKALTLCLLEGHEINSASAAQLVLPETTQLWNNQQVATLRKGDWSASACVSDYVYTKDSTPTGGSLTLLHHRQFGPILAATMTDYSLPEPTNMQYPLDEPVTCQTMRLIYQGEQTVTNPQATLQQTAAGDQEEIRATGYFADGNRYTLTYTLTAAEMQIKVATTAIGAQLQLPLIAAATDQSVVQQQGLLLYRQGQKLQVQIAGDWKVERDTSRADGLARHFNPTGGFQYLNVTVAVKEEPLLITFKLV